MNCSVRVPASETEDVPITCPIVLIAKRNKLKVSPNNISREQSLNAPRFCCDFRYQNSQTQDFRYTIPDIQDLTKSFWNQPEFGRLCSGWVLVSFDR